MVMCMVYGVCIDLTLTLCSYWQNGRDDVVIEGRKGFVRLALQFGADLVPTYTFHNVDSFHISKSLFQRPREWLQVLLKSQTTF